MTGHLPPQNLEAEQSTLGSMMIERMAMLRGLEILRAADFYRPAHQEIFDGLAALAERDEPCDLITLQEELRSRGKLEDCGGTGYLMALLDVVPTAGNVEHYANIVVAKSQARQVIAAALEIQADAYSAETDVEQLVQRFGQHAIDLSARRGSRSLSMPELTQAVWMRIEAYSQGKPKRGLSWGISRLDSMTYGLCPGNFVVLAAETSQGKTVLGTQVAKRAALAGHPVLYVSLEMSDADIIERALLSHAGVDMSRAFAGQIDSEEWERLGHAAEDFYSLPIHMETQLRTDSDVVTATKRGILQHGIELVVVDYLQLLRHSGKSWGPKDEVTQVSHNLALLAHNTNVPVLCLSQLSRAKDPKRPGTPLRPTLSRLKESGDIENDADKVVLIWNPKAGLQDVVDGIKMPVQALLIDAKHRGGPKGECPAWFEGQFARFIDCDDRWQDPEPSPEPFAAGFGGRNWWTD